jgi:hypothetical protein
LPVLGFERRPIETTPGMQGGGIKETDQGGEFNYDIFDTL